MSTHTLKRPLSRSAKAVRPEFNILTSARSLGYNRVQRVARYMIGPALLMGLMGIGGGLGVGIARGVDIHDGGHPARTIERLHHVQQGLTFLGMAFLFAGISFAIARILGQFRKGGGDFQEAAGRRVEVLKRPLTGLAFLGLMMMAMMTVIATSVLHFVFAADVTGSAHSLAVSDDRFTVLAGIERLGVGMYLVAIALGLATIIQVLRFQSQRIRQLPEEPAIRS
jgi:hypothetical protein